MRWVRKKNNEYNLNVLKMSIFGPKREKQSIKFSRRFERQGDGLNSQLQLVGRTFTHKKKQKNLDDPHLGGHHPPGDIIKRGVKKFGGACAN